MRKYKLLILIALLIGLTGCSIKIAYHFLDDILNWQLGSYVSLDSEQKVLADSIFKDFHQWHRSTQLPTYANYLNSLKGRINAGPISAEELHEETDKMQSLTDISVAYLLPGMVELSSSFSDAQVLEVNKNLDKEREKFINEYLKVNREKLYKLRIRDLNDYIESSFGDYTKEQQAWIDTWAHAVLDFEEKMVDQKLRWQADFNEAMQYRQDPEQLQKKLSALVFYRTDNWDPELQKIIDANQTLTYELLARLINSRSEKQKKIMNERFDRYIKVFEEMHAVNK